MFPHLCRTCLKEFNDSSDIVPLFEIHKNICYYRLINTTFRLSLTQNDNLATNICKCCAIEILKSYKFRLKYIESDRKLRKMLDQSNEEPVQYTNLLDVEVSIDETAGGMLNPCNLNESKWKCTLCASSFSSRSQLRDHRRSCHSNVVSGPGRPLNKPKENRPKRWKCTYCVSAVFRTKTLKQNHEREQHQNVSVNEQTILIDDDDSDNEICFPNITEVNVDDEHANEFKLADQEPEMDLGLYLIEKHSQSGNYDPLEVNHPVSNSLSSNAGSHPLKVKAVDDINDKWTCRICSEKFRTRDLLREHNHLHMATKASHPKPLTKKTKRIEKTSDRQVVVNAVPKDRKWQCQLCLLNFETRELQRTHRRTHMVMKKSTDLGDNEAKAPEVKAIKVYGGPKVKRMREMEQQSDM